MTEAQKQTLAAVNHEEYEIRESGKVLAWEPDDGTTGNEPWVIEQNGSMHRYDPLDTEWDL